MSFYLEYVDVKSSVFKEGNSKHKELRVQFCRFQLDIRNSYLNAKAVSKGEPPSQGLLNAR